MQEFTAIIVAENGAFSRAVIAKVADIQHIKSVIKALSDEV